MHKLDRELVAVPQCLDQYNYQTHTWEDMNHDDKMQIREQLNELQVFRCAYCESAIYDNGHIEHFRRKNQNHFPSLTFVWSNLFYSCGSKEHCGHFKDRNGALPYNPIVLIKPDDDDPDDYFYLHSSGEIRHRSGISVYDQNRVYETIRVFNLNCGVLKAERRRTLRSYEQKQLGILDELMNFDEQTRQEFIAEEIQATHRDPHCTVIRHYFEKAH